MAKQTINIGTVANDGTGHTHRAAFDICNDNFTELYDDLTVASLRATLGTEYIFNADPGTNVTTELQAAIDDYDFVSIRKPGTYYFSLTGVDPGLNCDYGLLVDKDDFTLEIGPGVTLKLADNECGPLVANGIFFLSRSNISIVGSGTIDMNCDNQAGSGQTYGQGVGQAIYGSSKSGDGCHNILIEGITIKNTFGNPVNIGTVNDSSNVVYRDLHCQNFGEGPQVVACQNVMMTGCRLTEFSNLNGDLFEASNCHNVCVSHNLGYNASRPVSGGSCVDVYGSQDVAIVGNVFENMTAPIGLQHFPGSQRCTRVTVSGNTFRNLGYGSAGDGTSVIYSNNYWYKIDYFYSASLAPVSVTLTRSGSTVTVAQASHGYEIGERIDIRGATETEYNGTVTVASVAANSWTYSISATPSSPATGSPTADPSSNHIKHIGDVFEEVGQYHCGGNLHVEMRGCTFLNCPADNSFILLFVANSNRDIAPYLIVDGCSFINGRIACININGDQTGNDYSPTVVVTNSDFTKANVAPVIGNNDGTTDNVFGGNNKGYTVPAQSTDPQGVADLRCWWAANYGMWSDDAKTTRVTASGQLVRRWTPYGTGPDLLAPSDLLRPARNSGGGIEGNAAAYMQAETNLDLSGPYTVIARVVSDVAFGDPAAQFVTLVISGSAHCINAFQSTTVRHYEDADPNVTTISTQPATEMVVALRVDSDGTTTVIKPDGTIGSSATTTQVSNDTELWVLCYKAAASPSNAVVRDLLIFDRLLSADEFNGISRFLLGQSTDVVVTFDDLGATLTTPASAAASGTAGTIAADANYIYVCTATNTWKRVAIATW